MSNIDLERKLESAIIARLQQQDDLKGMGFKPNSSEQPRVNGDVVVVATRGEQDPPYSQVFRLEVTITMRTRIEKTAGSLNTFLSKCRSLEDVLGVNWQEMSIQLSALQPAFHCYEFLVTGKDDTPEDSAHRCLWSCTAIAMATDFTTADNLNPP